MRVSEEERSDSHFRLDSDWGYANALRVMTIFTGL